MTEFGLLCLLWWRALQTRSPAIAIGIALAYAASDEFHQSFVSGRHASPLDWCIDGVGVALAVYLLTASRARSR